MAVETKKTVEESSDIKTSEKPGTPTKVDTLTLKSGVKVITVESTRRKSILVTGDHNINLEKAGGKNVKVILNGAIELGEAEESSVIVGEKIILKSQEIDYFIATVSSNVTLVVFDKTGEKGKATIFALP